MTDLIWCLCYPRCWNLSPLLSYIIPWPSLTCRPHILSRRRTQTHRHIDTSTHPQKSSVCVHVWCEVWSVHVMFRSLQQVQYVLEHRRTFPSQSKSSKLCICNTLPNDTYFFTPYTTAAAVLTACALEHTAAAAAKQAGRLRRSTQHEHWDRARVCGSRPKRALLTYLTLPYTRKWSERVRSSKEGGFVWAGISPRQAK